jgi:hypothetical protein
LTNSFFSLQEAGEDLSTKKEGRGRFTVSRRLVCIVKNEIRMIVV